MLHSDTPHSVGRLWTSNQPDAETSIWQTQNSQETAIGASGGIRTRSPSKPAAANLRFRPRGQPDWPCDALRCVNQCKSRIYLFSSGQEVGLWHHQCFCVSVYECSCWTPYLSLRAPIDAGWICVSAMRPSQSACHGSRRAEASLRGCQSLDTSRRSNRICCAHTPWKWWPMLWELG
jgi:hypothetical protein